MSPIDDIKSKIDIVELIGSLGVNLRKAGRNYVGFCPFHPNSRTPAFTVYPDNGTFHCFGCKATGSAFDFVMRKQGLEFKDALELLAARAGVRLEPKNEQERQEDARKVKLLEINAAAAKYFNYVLNSISRAQPGRDYVAKRGLDPEIVETFQLGYSLDDWGHLLAYLTEKKGYDPADIEAAGLAINHETRGYYDRFRGRLIFPIRNARGDVVGFGGRAIGDVQPKYLNTPETLLFKKGELLYGLDLAREAIRSDDRTIVVEGYVDVISAHQHGFKNVVAPLGTALTKPHVALLKRLSHNVYLALDADAAGQKATLRGLSALRESAEENGDGRLVATAEGAVRLESDVALRIIRMPEGRDPDEVIRADPTLWQRLIDQAAPVMEFYLEAYTAGVDLHTPEGQRIALDRLLPLLRELDGAQQRVYIARVEQVVGIKAELILDLLRSTNQPRRPTQRDRRIGTQNAAPRRDGRFGKPGERNRPEAARRPTGGIAAPPDDAPHPADMATAASADTARTAPPVSTRTATFADEQHLLAMAMRHTPIDQLVGELLEQGLIKHSAVRPIFGDNLGSLLSDPLHQEIWRRYGSVAVEQRPSTPEGLNTWAELQGEPLRERIIELVAWSERQPVDLRYRREAEDCALKLRRSQITRYLTQLNERARDNTEDIDELLAAYTRVNAYRAELNTPPVSSTFLDVRHTLGRE
ncbi:MAG: DNA primase [Oscillochloris sp.]|nr:DNA primase [Oscillochloris sp.]